MARCFVIQPFDGGGPYDKRYKDVLFPAIKEAGLEPYRVDEDHSVTVPIDAIEQNIRTSEICLADITLDNANIWYEVGYAFASNRPVVMICAKSRPTKYPFDVQHRHIISYNQDSTSDFDKLRLDVTARLKAQVEGAATMRSLASLSPVKTDGDLSNYEIAMLVAIMANRLSPNDGLRAYELQKLMRRAGYTDVATSVSLETLRRKSLVMFKQVEVDDINGSYTVDVYELTEPGLDWILENQHRLKMLLAEDEKNPDEDIPF